MAKITAMVRCPGLQHVEFTVQRTNGNTVKRDYLNAEMMEAPEFTEDYVRERLSLLIRESQARGNTSFAQISADLIGREFVE